MVLKATFNLHVYGSIQSYAELTKEICTFFLYMAPYNSMRSLQKKYVYGSIQSYAELTKNMLLRIQFKIMLQLSIKIKLTISLSLSIDTVAINLS